MQLYASYGHRDRVRILVAIAIIAAALWLATIEWARSMGIMPGTMGMGLAAFVVMWTLMMAAMMLPSSSTMISLYAGTLRMHRDRRLVAFVTGYLLAWSLTGIPVYALAWFTGRLTADHPAWATAAAAVIFAICGIYQLSSLKDRCLHHCRSPLSHLLHYGSYHGRFRDVRAGLHHGMFCLGCCWALMLLMIAFGVMNLAAMIILAAVVALEKLWSRGAMVTKITGAASLVLAVCVIFAPGLAPGLKSIMMDSM